MSACQFARVLKCIFFGLPADRRNTNQSECMKKRRSTGQKKTRSKLSPPRALGVTNFCCCSFFRQRIRVALRHGLIFARYLDDGQSHTFGFPRRRRRHLEEWIFFSSHGHESEAREKGIHPSLKCLSLPVGVLPRREVRAAQSRVNSVYYHLSKSYFHRLTTARPGTGLLGKTAEKTEGEKENK